MIINLDTENPKSIEEKVKELILKKLYVKVDDEQIFIEKEAFISLILKDIIVIATSDYDMDIALAMFLELEPKQKAIPDVKRNELKETLVEFDNEIEAYRFFLDAIEDEIPDDEIYINVLSILNSDRDLLEKRLHEIMMLSMGKRLSEEEAKSMNVSLYQLLDVFANQIKLLALYDDIEDVVDVAYSEFESYSDKDLISKESIKKSFLRISPLAENEIAAYKMALNLEEQSTEIPMILAVTRKMLSLEEGS